MSSNPYEVPGQDDDLFEPSVGGSKINTAHLIDGTRCPACGKIHSVAIPDDAPEELVNRLVDYLDDMPSGDGTVILSSGNSLANKILSDFVSVAVETDATATAAPLQRALCEQAQSGNAVPDFRQRMQLYEAERYLIITHSFMRLVSRMRAQMLGRDDLGDNGPAIADTFNMIGESITYRLQLATDGYRKAAAEGGFDVDENLLQNGRYGDDVSEFALILIERPIVKGIEREENA